MAARFSLHHISAAPALLKLIAEKNFLLLKETAEALRKTQCSHDTHCRGRTNNTNKQHQQTTPTNNTNKQHQQTTPTNNTNKQLTKTVI
jgi:hypothetical protein